MKMVWKYMHVIAILLVFTILMWRMLTIGYSYILYGGFADRKGDAVYEKVLHIYPQHVGALFKLADKKHILGEYKKSNQYLFRAINLDPTYGRAMALLLKNFSIIGDTTKADKAAYFADLLGPAHSYVRGQLLAYWLSKNNQEKIFKELSILLTRNGSLRSKAYVVLDEWLANKKNRYLFIPYMLNPPKWWNSYFSYLSHKKNNLETVEFLYKERLKSSDGVTKYETQKMISRLVRENKWKEARQMWLSSLPSNMQRYKQEIFDGGFESGLKNTEFTWNYRTSKIYSVNIKSTYGVVGRKALYVKFKQKKRINFKNVYQRTFFQSGKVKIGFRVRIDGDVGEKGLKWRLRCVGSNKVLGETEPFIARKQWYLTMLEASVPSKSCHIQLLRLAASSTFAHQQVFSGALWFDKIKVLKEEKK